ncbi:hypothetical protein [Heyndrickxia ginsengihumi]|uniref:hypothetical protein n=2 Tax=Bacillales TaxID=1385 RepID=UPI0004721A2E|nr:hypothetical protein [Heyndrickxia ginsengihumi]
MSKSTVLVIRVSQSKKKGNNYFNVNIEGLNVMLTVHENKQPKSYARIKEWIASDEPERNPILDFGYFFQRTTRMF